MGSNEFCCCSVVLLLFFSFFKLIEGLSGLGAIFFCVYCYLLMIQNMMNYQHIVICLNQCFYVHRAYSFIFANIFGALQMAQVAFVSHIAEGTVHKWITPVSSPKIGQNNAS